MNTLYNDDCIERMKILVEEGVKVDSIITDPPYNISKKNNFHTLKGRHGIDFGEWDKSFHQLKWLKHANTLLKPGGNIIIFNDWKNLGAIAKFLNQTHDYEIKDLIRWVKKNPMPRNRDRRYITDYELAVWLVKKGGKWTFNRQNSKYQRPRFELGIVSGKEKNGHPTQKPLKLMEELVKIHTNKNDVVLDPFMGSGSTIEACKNLNRRFIGIEKNKKYFNLAKNRVDITKMKSPLNYLGGKYKYLDQIVPYFPKKITGTFFDVFLGSGEISLNIGYSKVMSFEKNKLLFNLYKLFKQHSFIKLDEDVKKIITEFNLTISSSGQKYEKIMNRGLKDHNKTGYIKLRTSYNAKPSTIKLLVLIMYSFNNQIRVNSKGGFNIPVGKSDYNSTIRSNLEAICTRVKEKNKQLTVYNEDFFDFDIKKIKKNDFLYLDPPYLITNATYNEQNGWTEVEEHKLIKILKYLNKKKVKWALTNVLEKNGKKNTILEKFILDNNFNVVKINSTYKNYRRAKGKTVEVLVMNYEKK